MLENKTANNIVDRYHRIITGDQNQIETGIQPEGTIKITENGSDIDVAQYAKADVNVSFSAMESARKIMLAYDPNSPISLRSAQVFNTNSQGEKITTKFKATPAECYIRKDVNLSVWNEPILIQIETGYDQKNILAGTAISTSGSTRVTLVSVSGNDGSSYIRRFVLYAETYANNDTITISFDLAQ